MAQSKGVRDRSDGCEEMTDIILDLPPPLSVNRLRRIDWSAEVRNSAWKDQAYRHVLIAKRRPENPIKLERIERFEITIVFDENKVGLDLDNGVKGLIDFLCLVELIAGDAPKHMRRLVVEFGEAPTGTRITIKRL